MFMIIKYLTTQSVKVKSDTFNQIMNYISSQKNLCTVKEQNNKLMLVFDNVRDIHQAKVIIQNVLQGIGK
jgi:hypothetical protein